MKFYSEQLKKFFDSEKECVEAEEAHSKAIAEEEKRKAALVEERSNRAKEVEELYKAAVEAKQAYNDKLQEFLNDYGSFHATFRNVDPFFSLFDWF